MNQPLAEAIFWVAALACGAAELAILRFTFAARRTEKSELVPVASRGGEAAWAIIPAIVLACLFVVTWQRIEARDARTQMMDHSGMQHSMPMPGMTPSPSPR